MSGVYYEYNEIGDLCAVEYDILPSGRFQIVEGKWIRVGEPRAFKDEPWCNKNIDWNKGVKNPMDGKTYGSKQDYLDSVARGGGQVIGENANKSPKKKEVSGDFDVVNDLKQATQQVLSKRGKNGKLK